MLQEKTYSTPQGLIKDVTEQLSRTYDLAEEITDSTSDEELFELLLSLPEGQSAIEDDEFSATYYNFLSMEYRQDNFDIVFRAVFAA